MRNSRRSSKVHGDNWKSQRRLLGFVKGWMAESTERPVARMMITSQNWRVSWKQRNPRECVWKELHQEFMKTTLQEEGVILCNITIWYTNSLRCLKQWRYLKQQQQWTKNGKNLIKFRHGIWRKSETINEARKKRCESTFFDTDGSLSSQECWVTEETPEV